VKSYNVRTMQEQRRIAPKWSNSTTLSSRAMPNPSAELFGKTELRPTSSWYVL